MTAILLLLLLILCLNLTSTFPRRGSGRGSIGIFRRVYMRSSSLATPTIEVSEVSGSTLKAKKRENFEKILIGIRVYECIHGDMLVPQQFVIPSNSSKWPEEVWDMKLGGSVHRIRNAGRYKEHHDELKDMGFPFDSQRRDFALVKLGFETYKGIHGHMLVPQQFVIPNTSEWPEEVWGMKLGYTVNVIRNAGQYKEYHDELKDMGFDFDSQRSDFADFAFVKLGLETYKGINGHMLVPQQFVIPSNTSKWPEEVWGMKLGSTVDNIRFKRTYNEYHDELKDMGFDFDSKRRDFASVKLGLETYKGIHGDILVPQLFVIPSNTSEWPEEVWCMKLGKTLHNIRKKGIYMEYHDELRDMGYDFDSRRRDFASVKLGLETYKGIHGHMLVPQHFVIPSNSSEWPEEVWGMKLGYTVNVIRNARHYKEHHDELKDMGFDFDSQLNKGRRDFALVQLGLKP